MKKKEVFILTGTAFVFCAYVFGSVAVNKKDRQVLREMLREIDSRIQDDTKETVRKLERVNDLQAQIGKTDERIAALQKKIAGFQNSVEKFQELERVQWVEGITARERTGDTDYLYRLVKEKRIEAGRLSVAEIDAVTLLAEGAFENRDYARAKEHSLASLRSEPNNLRAAAVWCCASVLLTPESVDNRQLLLPVVEHINSVSPDSYPALLAAGMMYRSEGDYILADERFRKAAEARPDLVEAQLARVDVLVALHRGMDALPEAMKQWKAGPRNDESALSVWQCLADETVETKKAFLHEWRASVDNSALSCGYLGDLSYAEGNLSEAIRWYRQAEQKRPTKNVYKKLSDFYAETGDKEKTSEYAQKYLSQLSPAVEKDRADFLSYSLKVIQDDIEDTRYADEHTESNRGNKN